MHTPPLISVLLADDHKIVLEGLQSLLEAEPELSVIGTALNGRDAVQQTLNLKPDVVVMDIAMPELNGLDAMRQIHATIPETKIVLLSAHGDETYVERGKELGAAGFLLKQSSAEFLADSIRRAYAGKTSYSPSVAKQANLEIAAPLARSGKANPKQQTLTIREAETLQLVAEGMANKQIADELGISIKTVEKHREHLMQKLDIHETAGLTRYAMSTGVIESSALDSY